MRGDGKPDIGSRAGYQAPRRRADMRDNAKVHGDLAPERWRFEGFTLDLAGRTLSDASGN